MPIEFPLSCVDPCTAVPALAMLHSIRFQEFNVTSTFSQVLFETADKVIPDRHAEILSIAVDCAPPDYPIQRRYTGVTGSSRKSIIRPPTLADRLRFDSRHLAGRVDRRPYAEVGNTL